MIIIADSGSTKTNWTIISNKKEADGRHMMDTIRTQGLNPFFTSREGLIEAYEAVKNVCQNMQPGFDSKDIRVYFYGAGMDSDEAFERIRKPLLEVFPGAYTDIQSDLLASCRATCGDEPGMVAIFGTGSNSCLYDGKKMVANVTALGNALDCDEGSGNAIGRKLIYGYLRHRMPKELAEEFHKEYPLTQDDFLTGVYNKPNPNRFMASFAPFAVHRQDNEWIKNMLHDVYGLFFREQIAYYENAPKVLHATGSIAYYCKPTIEKVAEEYGYKMGVVIADPMEGLIQYHIEQNFKD